MKSTSWFQQPVWTLSSEQQYFIQNPLLAEDVLKMIFCLCIVSTVPAYVPHCWPFVWRIHRSPTNSPHKGQWRGALMFSLICAWINSWVNNHQAGDLRRHHAQYDVIVMILSWANKVISLCINQVTFLKLRLCVWYNKWYILIMTLDE